MTVQVADKDGNIVPTDDRMVKFAVSGAGSYEAAANGDATCLDLFHEPRMHAFGGMCTVIVRMGTTEGTARLTVRGKGLKGSISW